MPPEIINFSEVAQEYKTNILLGNGFSISVSRSFSYNSLKEEALNRGHFTSQETALFDAFDTVNFELVLKHLHDAIKVNSALSIPDNGTVAVRHDIIKNALIKTVNDIHPTFSDFNLNWAVSAAHHLQGYETVFTTNYDLILYWIIGQVSFLGFTDFFWSGDLEFDQFNTEPQGRRAKIYYLHGALFIFQNEHTARIYKLRSRFFSNLLDSITSNMQEEKIPLFISEGTHQQKLAAIYREPYLSFCYGALRNCDGGIVIFGNSLSDADEHLVSAINASGINRLAYSIYIGSRSDEDIRSEISYVRYRLARLLRKGGDIVFFDSKTAPLSYDSSTS